ncbi:phosphatidate cytidylyltransferase, partial [Ferruginibacter sp.]
YLKYCLVGLVYVTMPIVIMVDLRNIWSDYEGFKTHSDFGNTLPVCIVFSIWINDTMAYIVGSLIGKTPFSKISPKKTWEGTIGGAILAILIIGFLFPLLADKYFYPFAQHKICFVIAALCAIFGTIGDLFESKLKRMANVKDSGTIMPGHGGFLDRFDSLLFAAPAVWLYVKLFMN